MTALTYAFLFAVWAYWFHVIIRALAGRTFTRSKP